ncbi:transketolase [Phenylobacterium sp. J426]|uniref:transketolase n=1 Tax=Phenylobacterium sp. J426 TaxID=2898439 RepID=UPI002151AD62|nr:transketolase [Phenylobacterium sp. J426]MCR5873842.1 transketolase [Phenylobacterium sp. J426]
MPSAQKRPAPGHNLGTAPHIARLQKIDERLRWLATWTIHNANHLRESRDGLKVGGHQASCASMTSILTALYFHALGPKDRVAVKPHASPVFHAAQYLMGRQTRQQLEDFRSFGGAQSYPSRTKDRDDVDFSTGSVGLGVAITAFASLTQDYLKAHGWLDPAREGRMVATLGDAELDEGNIYECLIEAYKHDIRNCWWIVDYNRQSLDATTADRMFDRFDDIFETAGWRVVTLKWGKAQQRAFSRPGGAALKSWIEGCSNAEYAALTYQGGAAWRQRLTRDIGGAPGAAGLLESFSDDELHALMIGLGGHCMETLVEAFDEASRDDTPTLFIAYTVKGFGLPLQGHKDNHAGLMTPSQVEALRRSLEIPEGAEWEPYGGLPAEDAEALSAFVAQAPFAQDAERTARGAENPRAGRGRVPGSGRRGAVHPGRLRQDPPGARKVEGAAGRSDRDDKPGRHGLHQPRRVREPARPVPSPRDGRCLPRREDPSAQKWAGGHAGQHVELGIAEHNLFLNLAALGLAGPLWGERLLPIGTVYDPFISRGLDALNYACYQDARFMLVATPSGLTLGPEGGAHQSIYTPLIGIGQPGLTYFEPAFVDELSLVMRWSFEHMQADDGGSVYLRLTTRNLAQAPRTDDLWKPDALKGAYWLKAPAEGSDAAIVFCGAVAPEVLAAAEQLAEDLPGLGVLNVISPGLLHRDWMAARRGRWTSGETRESHAEALLGRLAPGAGLVTVVDGSPATLSWLGGVRGSRVSALGLDSFGQVGDLPDLYRHYRLDVDAIVDAAAELFL